MTTTDSQRLARLDLANEVRIAHARLHREFQALGKQKALRLAISLVLDGDRDVMTLRLTQLIGWIPALGRGGGRSRSQIADDLFETLGITVFDRRVGEISARQIAALVVELERLAGMR